MENSAMAVNSKTLETSLDDEINDSSNKVREVSYQLWQSLLTINGFLATVLIGIAAFSDIQELWVKNLVFVTVILLFSSSILIVLNYLNTKQVFQRIYKVLYEAKLFGKMPDEKGNEFYAGIRGIIMFITEKLLIILQLISCVLILVYLYYALFSPSNHLK